MGIPTIPKDYVVGRAQAALPAVHGHHGGRVAVEVGREDAAGVQRQQLRRRGVASGTCDKQTALLGLFLGCAVLHTTSSVWCFRCSQWDNTYKDQSLPESLERKHGKRYIHSRTDSVASVSLILPLPS